MNLKLLGLVLITIYIADVTTAQNNTATEKSDDKDVDEIIQMILESGRQGRNIDGLDDVYGDPTIQNALNSGDDAQARNLIRDKLCSLGLMQCDEVQGKRPAYYSPDDLIYAQPIAIKPVGRPIPSVPFRGPPPQQNPNYSRYPPPSSHNGPYGPPKPMPVQNNGPPRKVGYGGPPISKPYLNSPPSFTGPGPIYLSKPPGPIYEGPESPYEYERPGQFPGSSSSSSSSFSQAASFASQQSNDFHNEKPAFIVKAQGGALSSGPGNGLGGLSGAAVQQHVHHHFHHGETDVKGPVVINNPVPVPITVGGQHNSLSSNEFSSSGFQGSNQLSTNGFTPMSSGLSGYYGKQQNNGISSSISSGLIGSGGLNSGFGPVNGVTGNGVYGSNYQSSSNLLGSYSNGGKPVYETNSFNNPGPAQFGSVGSQFGSSGPQFGSSGSQFGSSGSQFGTSGSGLSSNIGSSGSFGQSLSGVYNNENSNSFHSSNPEFYKKELSVNGGYSANGLTGGLSQYSTGNQQKQLNQFNSQSLNQFNAGEKYQGFETERQEQYNCVCVAYEQCPANDVIGRKDDLILPLDPRNLNGKDIDAIVDENDSANKTVVRVTKEAEKLPADDKEKSVESETKKVSKRDVSEIKSEKKSNDPDVQADGEGRLLGLGGLGGDNKGYNYYDDERRVKPIFGFSVGLPYPVQDQPFDPYGGSNLYPNAFSPNGIELGLINVNPFLSFQFSRTDDGVKLIVPLVNLHFSPSGEFLRKVGDILHPNKGGNGNDCNDNGYGNFKGKFKRNGNDNGNGNGKGYGNGNCNGNGYDNGNDNGNGNSNGNGNGNGNDDHEIDPNQYQHHHSEPPADYYSPHHYAQPQYSEPPPHYLHHSGPEHYPHHSGPEYDPHHSGPENYPDYSGPQHYPQHSDGGGGHGLYREHSGPSAPPSGQNSRGYYDQSINYNSRSANISQPNVYQKYNYQSYYPQNNNKLTQSNVNYAKNYQKYTASQGAGNTRQARNSVSFPTSKRRRRDLSTADDKIKDLESSIAQERTLSPQKRQAFYNPRPQNNNFQNQIKQCGPRQVCCRRPVRQPQNFNTCGARNAQGITGRIKNPVYVDGDSEFGEYPWQVAILKKDPKESVYVCGGTLIDQHHIITAAHCIKSYKNFDLRVRLGEWDVNHDVEFYPYIERDVIQIHVHPEYYAGTLDNDIAILRLDRAVDYSQTPHISPACLPDKYSDFSGKRCWTTGWGKDAFGDYGKYQNILKEVDVPIIPDQQCQQQLRNTRLGYNYKLNPGFVCAGGEEGKDACKGDGGGPLVCERNGIWQLVGVVSWGIGCGQVNVPGVYVRVSHYLDWINQISHQF